MLEPKNTKDALNDEFWIYTMKEELTKFTRQNMWTLVPRPFDANSIGTKWVYQTKTYGKGEIVRNMAHLAAQGYSQEQGIEFDETYALVSWIELVRLLLAIACDLVFKLFQMDVKSVFLKSLLKDEVYVEQPKGFEDPHHGDYVYRLNKALYGLKQAPRAWYEQLTKFFIAKEFTRGSII